MLSRVASRGLAALPAAAAAHLVDSEHVVTADLHVLVHLLAFVGDSVSDDLAPFRWKGGGNC